MHEVLRSALALFAAAALGFGCSTGSGVGGESHFVCQNDADCQAHVPGGACRDGECVAPSDGAPLGPGACGGSPFIGKYLWEVGNCEVGALTAFDAETCEASVCGDNARTVDACPGHTFTYRVDGLTVTVAGGPTTTFVRSANCSGETGAGLASCEQRNCLLSHVDTLYTTTSTKNSPDDLWLLVDEAWPGVEACGSALPVLLGIDPSVCPDARADGGR